MLPGMAEEEPRRVRRRGPRKATGKALEMAALDYLRRYGSSTDNLRTVLMRRVERSAQGHGTDRREGVGLVDDIVRRLRETGLVDDRRYAAARAASLNARGLSTGAIRARLAAKGVAFELIDAALAGLSDDGVGADLKAAARFARRRRLGPFRPPEGRAERRLRDLAALARAGFDDEVALAVIDAEAPQVLEEQAGRGRFT
jgi:regulatory protein